MASNNHFEDVISSVQQAPESQRPLKLIEGIAQQMLQSDNPNVKQWGAELATNKTQLTRALQQGG